MRRLPRLFFLLATIVLTLLALTGGPSRAQSALQIPPDWNKALDSLADKIAAAAKPAKTFSLNVKNISSLSGTDVAGLREELVADLAARKFRITEKAPSDAQLQLTLSESADDYVWVAEIRRGDTREAVMVSAARDMVKNSTSAGPSITLQRKAIWEQAGKILDFGLVSEAATDRGSILVILEPDKLSFYEYRSGEWQLTRAVAIGRARPVERDVSGRINLPAGKAELPDVECSGNFQHPETVTCAGAAATQDAAFITNPIVMQERTVDSYAALAPVCGIGPLTLVSGPGDWTQPDEIQVYELKGHEAVVSGPPLKFPGPILALWASEDGKSARVVSRNLQMGAYEASIVSVSCGD
jgi:hypothetical protein